MSLTRRSFVKKSSYSAAAVTVLGTGVGLANFTSGPPSKPLTDLFRVTIYKKANGDWTTNVFEAEVMNVSDPHPAQPPTTADVGSPAPISPTHTAGGQPLALVFLSRQNIATNENSTGTRLALPMVGNPNPHFVEVTKQVIGGVAKGYTVEMTIKYIYPSNP
jgi:hypothetical protein